MRNEKIDAFVDVLRISAENGGLKNVVFHSPISGDAQKARGSLKLIGGKTVIQIETSLTEGRVTH